MRLDFEGGVYWNQPPYRCGEISRAAGFRGNTVVNSNTVDKLVLGVAIDVIITVMHIAILCSGKFVRGPIFMGFAGDRLTSW